MERRPCIRGVSFAQVVERVRVRDSLLDSWRASDPHLSPLPEGEEIGGE